MDIRFLGKNLTVTEGMKEHLQERLIRFEKYAPKLVESHVVLKKEKYLFEAEVTLLAKNLRAYGEGSSKENIFAAIDQASARVEKQLKKHREKIKGHHGKKEAEVRKAKVDFTHEDPLEVLEDSKPLIVEEKATLMKPMSPEEASMQLALSKDSFLMFTNAKTEKVNVIYKRADENHGLVEPKV